MAVPSIDPSLLGAPVFVLGSFSMRSHFVFGIHKEFAICRPRDLFSSVPHAFGPEDTIGHGGPIYVHLQGGGWHANFISLSKWSLDARPFVLGQIPLNKTIFNVSHCIITYAKDPCVFALRGVLNAQL